MVGDTDPNKRAYHPAALVPFQTNPEWIDAALASGTDTWRGYGRDPTEEGSNAGSAQAYQVAITSLVNNPRGGVMLPVGAMRPWSWNTPTTGGVTMTIFGMGFGWSPIQCSDVCLEEPNGAGNCPLPSCNFIESSVGDTLGEGTSWTSDSSVSMIVPPGIGADLPVNVTAGRFKHKLVLYNHFSYDAPVETRLSPGNSRLSGNVSVTVFGSNFGAHRPATRISLGESSCTSAIWSSDSQIICSKVIPGTGALLSAKVRVEDRPSENPPGITKVFSYDRPQITAVFPGNAPPSGFSVITVLGKNFGLGPDTKTATRDPLCPQDSPGQFKYVLKPRQTREAICGSGFVVPNTKRFTVKQPSIPTSTDPTAALDAIVWDNIRPFSLAYDPVACIINEYMCTYKRLEKYCAGIAESCIAVSNITVKAYNKYQQLQSMPGLEGAERPVDKDYGRWYALGSEEGACENLGPDSKCPPRIVSSYIKDGVTCDMMDQTNPLLPEPYFKENNIYTTDYLCSLSPRPLGGCSTCAKLGCCNKRCSTTITSQRLSECLAGCLFGFILRCRCD